MVLTGAGVSESFYALFSANNFSFSSTFPSKKSFWNVHFCPFPLQKVSVLRFFLAQTTKFRRNYYWSHTCKLFSWTGRRSGRTALPAWFYDFSRRLFEQRSITRLFDQYPITTRSNKRSRSRAASPTSGPATASTPGWRWTSQTCRTRSQCSTSPSSGGTRGEQVSAILWGKRRVFPKFLRQEERTTFQHAFFGASLVDIQHSFDMKLRNFSLHRLANMIIFVFILICQ